MSMHANQIILITGGGRGLGRAIALGAAQAGAQVAVTARSVSELTETVELIRHAGGRADGAAGRCHRLPRRRRNCRRRRERVGTDRCADQRCRQFSSLGQRCAG